MSKQAKPPKKGRHAGAPAKTATEGAKKVSANRRPVQTQSKLDRLVGLLRRPGGANLEAMIEATGWQAHSIRGAISGAIKKRLSLPVESERVEGERVYRIVGRK